MGSWGHKPLENDGAADLVDEFKETQDISLLERALNVVVDLEGNAYLEAPEAEQAIAATHILLNEEVNVQKEEYLQLLSKAGLAVARILESSELRELWEETDEYTDWLNSLETLVSGIGSRLES